MALPALFKTIAKATVVGLAVAAVATPTFAAPPPPPMHNPPPPPMHGPPPPPRPSLNFNFGFDVPGFRFGLGNRVCLTDGQIVRELYSRGYSSVHIVGHNFRHSNRGNWVKVVARRNGQTYTFYVDSCRGDVGFF